VSDVIALIDLGSNAVRFILAEIKRGGGTRVLRAERVQTRLGSGRGGRLPRLAVQSTVEAIHRFLHHARNGQPRERALRVRAFATAAVRDAPNRAGLINALRRREGVEVKILSSTEEARLGAVAALDSLSVKRALVADLGGGSLQLTRVRAERIISTASLPLGAVRLSRKFLRHDPPLPRELRSLTREVRDWLTRKLPSSDAGDEMVGLGGTVRTLARLHVGHGGDERHGLRLPRASVAAMRDQLAGLPLRKRRRIPGLKAERADIIVAGAVVVEEVMTMAGYRALTVCMRGVQDGLLLEEASPRRRRV
jgi:exopolyphosphatase/guanosine-5'-triphosphate,3'-diphosphate pyrophosphatase